MNAAYSSRLRNNSGTHFPLFVFFFFFILNKTTSCKNKMPFLSESDMMSKELQNSDLMYVNPMTDIFKTIVKYRQKIIAKYCHLSPSHNQALKVKTIVFILVQIFLTFNRTDMSFYSSYRVKYWKRIVLIFLYTLYKARRKSESSYSHLFLPVFPSLVMKRIYSFIL